MTKIENEAALKEGFKTENGNDNFNKEKKVNKKSVTLFISRTAVLLALTLVFQSIGLLIPEQTVKQFVVGSLVNFVLFIAVMGVGLLSASIIGLSTPFLAMLFNIAPLNIVLVPFVALGNFILALVFFLLQKLLFKKLSSKRVFTLIGILVAGTVKGVYLWFAFLNIAKVLLPKVPPVMLFTFSYPQLITAAIGGILAYLVIPSLKKAKIM